MKSMVSGHLKSKHNYRKKIRQNSPSFQLVICFERKGLSTRSVSFRKTNFKDLITYFKIILGRDFVKFSPKTNSFWFTEIFIFVLWQDMDCFWLYWKDTPIFFDDYQKLMNQYEVFERELAQYFTEELQNSKAFSEMQYFADTEQNL